MNKQICLMVACYTSFEWMCVCVFSCVQLFATLCEAPLSMGFPRQEYWSGLPFLSPGDLPNPGFEPMSPALAGGLFYTGPPGKPRAS